MKNETLVLLEFSRRGMIRLGESINEEEARLVPQGFNNNILWNVGHILNATESFMYAVNGREMQIPANYAELFGRGSKPADWTVEPPSFQTLITQVKDQTSRINETFADLLDQPLNTDRKFPIDPPPQTIGELLNFAIWHEAVHTGYMNAMKRVIDLAKNPTQAVH